MGGVYINNKAQGTEAAQFLTKSFAWRSCDGARFNYGLSTNHGPLIGPGKTRIDDATVAVYQKWASIARHHCLNCLVQCCSCSCCCMSRPLYHSLCPSVCPSHHSFFSARSWMTVARNSWNQSDCEFHASVQIHPKTIAPHHPLVGQFLDLRFS